VGPDGRPHCMEPVVPPHLLSRAKKLPKLQDPVQQVRAGPGPTWPEGSETGAPGQEMPTAFATVRTTNLNCPTSKTKPT
jgi:hypothetical protein